MGKLGILIALVIAVSALSATSITGVLGTTGNVGGAIIALCSGLKDLLPVAAMLMIILAGVIYASGQMMGAETRARANVWATACLTGALIAILIVVVAPPVMDAIYGPGSAISQSGC